MIARVGSANDRRSSSRTSGHGEGVSQAVGGLTDGDSGFQDLSATKFRDCAGGAGAGAGNHKSVEVKSKLKL